MAAEQITKDNVSDVMNYRPPTDETKPKFAAVSAAAIAFANAIIDNAPPSPERTLALRAVQESKMWANASIAHDGRF